MGTDFSQRNSVFVTGHAAYRLQRWDDAARAFQTAARSFDAIPRVADWTDWSPRIGVAWSPGAKKAVFRAGYGIFYGRTPSIMVGTAHSNNGINVQIAEEGQTVSCAGGFTPYRDGVDCPQGIPAIPGPEGAPSIDNTIFGLIDPTPW